MNDPQRQPQVEFHPAHWAAINDQRDRMMDVRSVLACARCALLNDHKIDVLGAVSLAHETLDDIIDKLDSAALDTVMEEWLAAHESPRKDG